MFALSGWFFAQPALTAADLSHLQGGWTGELMYINYDDGTPGTIPATLLFEPVGNDQWRIGYIEAPHANELIPYRSVRMAEPSMVAP